MREVLPERCMWSPRTMGHILSHNNFPSSLFSIIYNGRNSESYIFFVIYIYSNFPSSLFSIIDHELWSIVLDDHCSKTIYRPKMIVFVFPVLLFILRWSCFQSFTMSFVIYIFNNFPSFLFSIIYTWWNYESYNFL